MQRMGSRQRRARCPVALVESGEAAGVGEGRMRAFQAQRWQRICHRYNLIPMMAV